MGLEADSLAAWLEQHPPAHARFKASLAAIGRGASELEDFLSAVRDLLDELALVPESRIVARAIAEEPPLTGDARLDAYLGALAEHLAVSSGQPVPGWALRPERFLERFWFVSATQAFRATAIAQAPAAFRRRGVFVPARSLQRV